MAGENSDKRPEVPDQLLDFVNDQEMRASLPVRFHFAKKDFILEILLFLDVCDPSNSVKEGNYLRFARNGDGFVLLVDPSTDDPEVMQEELGDIDSLGLTLSELRQAEWESI